MLAVALISPGTISAPGTYKIPRMPNGIIRRYVAPVRRERFLILMPRVLKIIDVLANKNGSATYVLSELHTIYQLLKRFDYEKLFTFSSKDIILGACG